MIAQWCQELAEAKTSKHLKRSLATVKSYLAPLSTVMAYGIREYGWMTDDNPCLRVTKFKESKGREKIASSGECLALLEDVKIAVMNMGCLLCFWSLL